MVVVVAVIVVAAVVAEAVFSSKIICRWNISKIDSIDITVQIKMNKFFFVVAATVDDEFFDVIVDGDESRLQSISESSLFLCVCRSADSVMIVETWLWQIGVHILINDVDIWNTSSSYREFCKRL